MPWPVVALLTDQRSSACGAADWTDGSAHDGANASGWYAARLALGSHDIAAEHAAFHRLGNGSASASLATFEARCLAARGAERVHPRACETRRVEAAAPSPLVVRKR